MTDRAKKEGYLLNPDEDFLKSLFEGLYKNVERYGLSILPLQNFGWNFRRRY